MAKLEKDKIALFLACASVLSGQTSAMNVNKAQSPKTVAAVGGAAPQVRKGMPVGAKVLLGIIGGASVIELIHSGFGFFTNSILGKYSLGELAKKALNGKKVPGDKKKDNKERSDVPDDEKKDEGTIVNKNEPGDARKALAKKILDFIDGLEHFDQTPKKLEEAFSCKSDTEAFDEAYKIYKDYLYNFYSIFDKLAKNESEKVTRRVNKDIAFDYIVTYEDNSIILKCGNEVYTYTLDKDENLILELKYSNQDRTIRFKKLKIPNKN